MKKGHPLLSAHEDRLAEETVKTAVKVAKRICKLYPKILLVQPHITGITTGMGTWSFDGYGVGVSTEDGCQGDEVKIEDVRLADIITNGYPDWYTLPMNKELIEVVALVNFLAGMSELNCSAWQNGFNENGVIFYHSETSNQNNPFATPNKKYFTESDYYKQLVRAKVPIALINEDTLNNSSNENPKEGIPTA